MMIRTAALCVLTLAILVSTACGGDEEANNSNPFTNAANGDAGNSTTPNNTSSSDGGVADMEDVSGACAVTTDLGVIGDVAMSDAEFAATSEVSATSCAGDDAAGETDGMAIVKFTLDAPRRIDVRVDGVPLFNNDVPVIPPQPSWEIRSAPCDTGEVVSCAVERDEQVELPAGDYFMIINGRLDSGGFELNLTSEELICMPGSSACVGDQVERCSMGTNLETFPCFDTCSSETACTGDTCADIVGVTIEANGAPYTIEGHRRAQSNEWTAQPLSGCELFPGDPSPDTPGVDLFVRVDGLSPGQTLRVDAERSDGNYAFFVLPDCAATSCMHAGDFDSVGDNATEWNVTQGGPVVVVVEALGTSEREIVVDISVID